MQVGSFKKYMQVGEIKIPKNERKRKGKEDLGTNKQTKRTLVGQ